MRVCLDVSQSVYEGTGSGRYVIELVKGLLTLSEDNEYTLFGSAHKKNESLIQLSQMYKKINSTSSIKEKYLSLPPAVFELLWNRLHLVNIENFTGPVDLYHSSDWTQAPSRSLKITTVHDLIPFLFPEHVHPRIRRAHDFRWKHIIQDKVHVIVDAESTKRDIKNNFQLEDDRVSVIPLACSSHFYDVGKSKMQSSDQYRADSGTVLNKYSLMPNGYILAVGTLEPRKNIHRLIEAHNKLDSGMKAQARLVVVGKKAWAGEFPESEGVTFTGYVDDAELPYIYAGAKCFVMPSIYEGFGIPVLESMACATPVICSNRSSLPEIGGDDVHYIQDPENVESIRLMLNHVLESDADELDKVAKNGYNRAMNYSWERTARETLEVYKKLV